MTYREAMRQAAQNYIKAVLEQAGGSVSKAARLAACNRTNFHKLITKYGIRRPKPAHRGAWGELADTNHL